MATTLSGGSGTDVILPEGVNPDQVEVGVGADGNTLIVIEKNTAGVEVIAESTTAITGKKLTDSTVSVQADKGEKTKIVLETTKIKNTSVVNEGKGKLRVNVNTGQVKGLTVDAGENLKRADKVTIKDDVLLSKSEFNMGKGNDTVRFDKGATLKGKSTIDLGKGGKDMIVIKDDSLLESGKLVVTNFDKKDIIKVGGEKSSFKDIKNGAEIPGIKIELA